MFDLDTRLNHRINKIKFNTTQLNRLGKIKQAHNNSINVNKFKILIFLINALYFIAMLLDHGPSY